MTIPDAAAKRAALFSTRLSSPRDCTGSNGRFRAKAAVRELVRSTVAWPGAPLTRVQVPASPKGRTNLAETLDTPSADPGSLRHRAARAESFPPASGDVGYEAREAA